ncbi:hypothetical protein J416_12227 [Gracilibacillus halophilus YIM-C55.5]|uniref:Uncharacterized protein n=1 Tax=Gracilibacillus halophilus YIM-C55.5 TaxID=1308866 RepID=N4WNW0_9BACI|nr:DUF3603 family protein [Gracilibacillus halophilus]ENH96175.1 hypothetical protein J416_12227 [Gracilibacillus halophilus YIM-C55.5]
MLYLHDVWVNWFEGEENGYNVCSFHEWRKADGIEILDQIPVLYIEEEVYTYIENDLQDLPKSLLEIIYQKAYIRKNQERKPLEYAVIITDGESIMAFDTMGYEIPIRKSRLIPRQERLVLDLIKGRQPESFHISNREPKEYHILSLPPQAMTGLTRRERQLKQLLMIAIDQLEATNRLEELRYWLTEWKPERYHEIKQMDFNEAWTTLYNDLLNGWSTRHENFCRQIIKGQTYYENIWEREQQGDVSQTLRP